MTTENCNDLNCGCNYFNCGCNYFKALHKEYLDNDIDDDIDDHYLGPSDFIEPLKEYLQITSNSNLYKEGTLKIREFDTGATRDSNENKLEFARFNCPLVFKRFAQYMDLHRKQTNGDLRDPDNWKKLFGDKHEDVCMDSIMRHIEDIWLINKGFPNEAREDLESALCAIIFNAQAWLYKILKEKYEKTNK